MKTTMIILFSCLLLLANQGVQAQDGGFAIDNLFLSPNYFDNIEEAMKEPEKVHYIDLSMQSPKLTKIPDEVYTKFPNLKQINVSFNRVASVDDAIGNLTNLEVLNLEGNHYLTSLSEEIGKLKNLKELNIKTTGLKADKVGAIQKLLPEGCKITH